MAIGYIDHFDTLKYNYANATVSASNGILNVTTTTSDPQIQMNNIGSYDPSIYKWIEVKWQANLNTNIGPFEFFFLMSGSGASSGATRDQLVSTESLRGTGDWVVTRINMSTHEYWNSSYGNVLGWRFDPSTVPRVNVKFNYIALLSNNPPSPPTINYPLSDSVITTTRRPTFAWTFNDLLDSISTYKIEDYQTRFVVEVSNDNFASIYTTSNNLASRTSSWTPSIDLPDGNWVVRVKTADFAGEWGDWGTQAFQIRYRDTVRIVEDFEDNVFSMSLSNRNWQRTTTNPYAGSYCFGTAPKLGNSGTASATFTVTLPDGVIDPRLSFAYRLSSEVSDFFSCVINGNQVYKRGGDYPWQLFETGLAPGINTIAFNYTKDASGNSYEDKVFIDQIEVTYETSEPIVTSPKSQEIVNRDHLIQWDPAAPFVGFKEEWNNGYANYTPIGFSTPIHIPEGMTFRTNTADPRLLMSGLGKFDPNIYNTIEVKWRAAAGVSIGYMEIFFLNSSSTTASPTQAVATPNLVGTGDWVTTRIDMSLHEKWTTGGMITGWRFDPATVAWISYDIDYLALIATDFTYQVQLSTNGGSTWSDLVTETGMNVTSYLHNFLTYPTTTEAKIRVRAKRGTVYSLFNESKSFTIYLDDVPPVIHKVSPEFIHHSGSVHNVSIEATDNIGISRVGVEMVRPNGTSFQIADAKPNNNQWIGTYNFSSSEPEGRWQMRFTVYDYEDNSATATAVINYDRTVPTIGRVEDKIEIGPVTEEAVKLYAFSVTDAVSGVARVTFSFKKSMDGGISWTPTAQPVLATQEPGTSNWFILFNKNNGHGLYDFEIFAYDNAGNQSAVSRATLKFNSGLAMVGYSSEVEKGMDYIVVRGIIDSADDSAVIHHGHCWNIKGSDIPVIEKDRFVQYGTIQPKKSFSSRLTGLLPSSTYAVRAFAKTEYGTAYGPITYITTAKSGTVARLKDHELLLAGEVKERSPLAQKDLVSYFPFDGAIQDKAARYENDLVITKSRDWYGPSFKEHYSYRGAVFTISGSVRLIAAADLTIKTAIGFRYKFGDTSYRWMKSYVSPLSELSDQWADFYVEQVIPNDYIGQLLPFIQIEIPFNTPGYEVEYKDIRYAMISNPGIQMNKSLSTDYDGVCVQPGSKNNIINTDLDMMWTKSYCKNVWFNDSDPPVDINSQVVSFINAASDTTKAAYWFCYDDNAPQTRGSTYTVSIYVKTRDPNFRIRFYTGKNDQIGRYYSEYITVPNDGKWHRLIWNSFVVPSNSLSSSLSFQFYYGAQQGERQRTWLCAPQMEEKPYATPFTVGTRTDQGLLYLPKEVLNPASFSIAMKFKVPYMNRDSRIIGIGRTWFHPIVEWCPTVDEGASEGFALICGPYPDPYNKMLAFRGKVKATSKAPIEDDVWYDLVTTYDGTIYRAYLDGDQVLEKAGGFATSSDSTVLMVGGGYGGVANIRIKDFAVYNRPLTPEEVKKGSKGAFNINKDGSMVTQIVERTPGIPKESLFFDLGSDGLSYNQSIIPITESHVVYEEGSAWIGKAMSNIVPNPDAKNLVNGVPGSYKPGWDPALHSTAITVEGWSSGYNSGVASPGKGYHAQLVYEGMDGSLDPCMKFIDRNNEFGLGHRWLGVSTLLPISSTKWAEGMSLTLSWYQKTDVLGKGIRGGLYHASKSSGNYLFARAAKTIPCIGTDEWERASFTFTIDSDWDLTKSSRIYIYGNEGPYGTIWADNVQLEVGAFASPFTVSSRDTGDLQYPHDLFNLAQDFTITGWWKPLSITSGVYNPIITLNTKNNNTTNKRVLLMDHSNSNPSLRLWYGNGTAETTITSQQEITIDKWNYFAIKRDGATVSLFHGVDGVGITKVTSPHGSYFDALQLLLDPTMAWHIGRYDSASNIGNSYHRDYAFIPNALPDVDIERNFKTSMKDTQTSTILRGGIKEGKVL